MAAQQKHWNQQQQLLRLLLLLLSHVLRSPAHLQW
jgi:hypothetical protein